MTKKLTFYYSSMNSGKSLNLITKNYMFTQKGFNTFLMKPSTDTRTKNTIKTRLEGVEIESHIIKTNELPSKILSKNMKEKIDYVIVDEVQFLTKKQIWDISNIVDYMGIEVLCYGLKLDWQGNFFEGSLELLRLADDIIAIENLCKYEQGMPAYFHYKDGGSKKQIEISDKDDIYESVSRKAWKDKMGLGI